MIWSSKTLTICFSETICSNGAGPAGKKKGLASRDSAQSRALPRAGPDLVGSDHMDTAAGAHTNQCKPVTIWPRTVGPDPWGEQGKNGGPSWLMLFSFFPSHRRSWLFRNKRKDHCLFFFLLYRWCQLMSILQFRQYCIRLFYLELNSHVIRHISQS